MKGDLIIRHQPENAMEPWVLLQATNDKHPDDISATFNLVGRFISETKAIEAKEFLEND